MLAYHKQSDYACLAYAMLALGAVPKKAVREYEKSLLKTQRPTGIGVYWWADEWAKWYNAPMKERKTLPRIGKGIATVWVCHDDGANQHALAYENGRVMDPSESGPGIPETLPGLLKRYASRGWKGELIGVTPYQL